MGGARRSGEARDGEWIRRHARATRAGLARRRAEGASLGRPPKDLTEEEVELAVRMRAGGKGLRKIAAEVSRRRREPISVTPIRKALLRQEP